MISKRWSKFFSCTEMSCQILLLISKPLAGVWKSFFYKKPLLYLPPPQHTPFVEYFFVTGFDL